jgi:hypothetical protein
MMHEEARPFASLSSGLLARKGGAKPAMRPQGFGGGFEDLGWNDMGAPEGPTPPAPIEHVPSSIAALTPFPKAEGNPVAAQQRAIAETFEDVVEDIVPAPVAQRIPAEVVSLPKRVVVAAGRKAAFTLRLDAERHLRLRLACAVTGRSAQQLVAGAVDQFLATVPEIDALAAQLPVKRR